MIDIVDSAIDVAVLERAIRSPQCGGVVTFLGVVRDRASDGREVDGLEYEAHRQMALAEFALIVAEAAAKWPDSRVVVVHRIGALKIGEIAVAVCAAARHRGDAFRACEYTIDELKKRAPIWKKERYLDGTAEWVENAC